MAQSPVLQDAENRRGDEHSSPPLPDASPSSTNPAQPMYPVSAGAGVSPAAFCNLRQQKTHAPNRLENTLLPCPVRQRGYVPRAAPRLWRGRQLTSGTECGSQGEFVKGCQRQSVQQIGQDHARPG